VFERNCSFIPENRQVDELYKKGILHMEIIETTWANVAPSIDCPLKEVSNEEWSYVSTVYFFLYTAAYCMSVSRGWVMGHISKEM
jgi:hypothetical protein